MSLYPLIAAFFVLAFASLVTNMLRIRGGEHSSEAFGSGTLAGAGSFRCDTCGYAVALQERDELPACPHCSGGRFRRSSIFAGDAPAPSGDHGVEHPSWLEDIRDSLDGEGLHMAWEDGEVRTLRLAEGWTRIGRSLSADVRFDDPTVSRRHALMHRDGLKARVLDDRSLNGVFINGDRVDWHELEDGDEIAIGRFRLHFLRVSGAPGATAAEEEMGEAVR